MLLLIVLTTVFFGVTAVIVNSLAVRHEREAFAGKMDDMDIDVALRSGNPELVGLAGLAKGKGKERVA